MTALKSLSEFCFELLKEQTFDCLAVGIIDFKTSSFDCFEIPFKGAIDLSPKLYFDLASVTKILNLATGQLIDPNLFNEEKMRLLLNHQAGIAAFGKISRVDWRQYIESFPIKKSPTIYSDYGALRLMLELEKKLGKPLKEFVSPVWDKEICFWKELPAKIVTPFTGYREGRRITREVHDPNAYWIGEYCAHAGLFGTVSGLCKTMLNLNNKYHMIERVLNEYQSNQNLDRFILGFDRVTDIENTLAGKGCSLHTFGHLGFTGTSVWVDADKQKGAVILSNATKEYWYDKTPLNQMRKEINRQIWATILSTPLRFSHPAF